jgi:hypothetical protein
MDFAAGVYLSEPGTEPNTPHLTHLYMYTVYLFTKGRGRRIEPERRLEGDTVQKAGSKIPT